MQAKVNRYMLKDKPKIKELFSGLPLTFLLGFYVSLVVQRWWEQYCKLPWPDSIAIFLRGLVTGGQGDQARMVCLDL